MKVNADPVKSDQDHRPSSDICPEMYQLPHTYSECQMRIKLTSHRDLECGIRQASLLHQFNADPGIFQRFNLLGSKSPNLFKISPH